MTLVKNDERLKFLIPVDELNKMSEQEKNQKMRQVASEFIQDAAKTFTAGGDKLVNPVFIFDIHVRIIYFHYMSLLSFLFIINH